MKTILLLFGVLFSLQILAQKRELSQHQKIYGKKPSLTGMIKASQLDSFMAQKVRISTTISGKIISVTKPKGGWFQLDAGNGKVISAHFSNYNMNIPASLAGKKVIVEGVAERLFIADDQQHFAGDTANGKKQHHVKTNHKRGLNFEVTGLMVE